MKKELTDQEVVAILDKYREDMNNFKRYLTVLLESTPAHTIVIFDKIYGDEYKDVAAQLVNPHQVFSGSFEENTSTFLSLIWTLYQEFVESGRQSVDAVLPELEKLNAMSLAWRLAHKKMKPAVETLKKQKEFRDNFNLDAMETNRAVVSTDKFPTYFENLCEKYGMRGFAVYSKLNNQNETVMAGYSASEVLNEQSLQFTQIFAALCENTVMGDCLATAFERFYELMHKYEAMQR
jgi:hypothetical protein